MIQPDGGIRQAVPMTLTQLSAYKHLKLYAESS
jgi:hypothetical protein